MRIMMKKKGTGSEPKVIASDDGIDWYGERTSSEVISGDALALELGLSEGIAQNSEEGWLDVGIDGTRLLIAKKPFRRNITWTAMNAVGAGYGTAVTTITGSQYKVRLMKTLTTASGPLASGYDASVTHGSEWNRIFYRLVASPIEYIVNGAKRDSEIPFVELASYSEQDLVLDGNIGPVGGYTICMEEAGSGSRYSRGAVGVSYLSYNGQSVTNEYHGWRPVLELI